MATRASPLLAAKSGSCTVGPQIPDRRGGKAPARCQVQGRALLRLGLGRGACWSRWQVQGRGGRASSAAQWSLTRVPEKLSYTQPWYINSNVRRPQPQQAECSPGDGCVPALHRAGYLCSRSIRYLQSVRMCHQKLQCHHIINDARQHVWMVPCAHLASVGPSGCVAALTPHIHRDCVLCDPGLFCTTSFPPPGTPLHRML